MIAKTLFLAKTFSAICMRIFRDHEIPADRYPGGYPCQEGQEAVMFFPPRVPLVPAPRVHDQSSVVDRPRPVSSRSACARASAAAAPQRRAPGGALTCQLNCTDPLPPEVFVAETVTWYVPVAPPAAPLMIPWPLIASPGGSPAAL